VALLLSRLQFAFTISFHIIFPSFTIGLAAWLTVLEALHVKTGRPVYRAVFEFWLKIFGVAFGLGVVSGIVMGFQFGTNWSVLARMTGPIQGPLLSYETFTAFYLEASFFGILLFGRPRVRPWFYLFSTAMVALGTTLSAFWIMANNSWMQAPVGYVIQNGMFVPNDWFKIMFSPVLWVRFPHMLLASYITGAFCVAATGAWYALRGVFSAEARVMLRMGLYLAAVLVPMQIFFGHLNGDYVHDYQPAKFAAIEGRWHDEQPASEVLLAIPDSASETNKYAISVPILGSLIGSMSLHSKEVGLTDFPPANRPPVVIPYLHFQNHGRLRRRHVAAGLGRDLLEPQGPYRAEPTGAFADVPEFSAPLHCHVDRLVHRRGWTSTLGGLWAAANGRRRDSVFDSPHRFDFTHRLLRRVHLHIRLWNLLHLSVIARGTRGRRSCSAC
jgi:cytochrome bd ubiquinol oxidase subunit I